MRPQHERLMRDLVAAGDGLITIFDHVMAKGPEHATPVDDVDVSDAVETWHRLVDEARSEGLVPL